MNELLLWQGIAIALGICLAYTSFTMKQSIEDYINAFTTNECIRYFYFSNKSVANNTNIIEWNTTK